MADSLFMFSPTNSPWLSDALAVINPANGAQDPSKPRLGVVQRLQATVRSSAAREHVHVQFWVCAFGTAGSPYLASAGGTGGLLRPADDLGDNLTVGPGGELIVQIEWTPVRADITWIPANQPVPDVHCCLMANVFATDGSNDGAPLAGPPVLALGANPHHAQRNLTLITSSGAGSAMNLMMFAGNPFEEGEADFRFEVRQLRGHRLLDVELDHLLRRPWIARSEKGLAIEVGGERLPIRVAEEPLEELEIELGGERGPRLRTTLAAGSPQPLTLRADLPKEENVLRFFDVVQHAGDKIVGGARIMLLTLAKEPREDDRGGDYAA